MNTVAIAGGASPSVGRSIVTGILTLAPNWKIIILSRPSSAIPAWLTPIVESGRAEIRRVDYADHSSLVTALQGIHTVISAIGFSSGDRVPTELALLKGSIGAGVKRFAPSEYGTGVLAIPKLEAFSGSLGVWKACEEAAAAGSLEWTRYECGLLMNYLGFGVPSGELRDEALGGREGDGEWIYYPSACRAELPIKADGTSPRITMTAIEDVGKLIAKSLDLPAWETKSYIVGETLRMDEVVKIAEKVMGKKWEIETLSPEKLESRIASEEDEFKKMWAQLGLCFAKDTEEEGWFEGTLNSLCPDVTPLTVEAYLKKYYR